MAATTLTAQQEYVKRKIQLAVTGMKIAILLPTTAVITNVVNSYLTTQALSNVPNTALISVICSITLIVVGDLFASIGTFIWNAAHGKGFKEVKRTMSLKISWMMLISAVFAGPIATGCWMTATPFCGLTTVSVLVSLAPILTAFIGKFVLHEHLSGRVYIGIIITVLGVILNSWTGFSEGGSNFILGVILALMAPIGFTVENQLSTYAGDLIDPNVGCATFRCCGSFIIGTLAMIILSAATGNLEAFISIVSLMFTNPKCLILFIILGLLGAINYNAAYLAFNLTGPSRVMTIDASKAVLSIPVGFLCAALGIQEYSISTIGIIGAIVCFAGLIIVICKPSELTNFRGDE